MQVNSEMSATLDIGSFPTSVLQEVFAFLLSRPMRIDSPSDQWAPVVRLMSTKKGLANDSVCESLQESMPSLHPSISGECISWTTLLAALRNSSHSRAVWKSMQPLPAHRGGSTCSTSLRAAPKISGSSICFIGQNKIVIFGGRSSLTGDTVDKTYVAKLPSRSCSVVEWEVLHYCNGPPARCYHAALPGHADSTMAIFGGAGIESVSGLLADTWLLEVNSVHQNSSCVNSNRSASVREIACCGTWKECHGSSHCGSPSARSSHVFTAWKSPQGWAVLHGGLGEFGVLSDVWLWQATHDWVELKTNGPVVARAHHCGGIVRESLLVHSGQDSAYLTVDSVFTLHLDTLVWQSVSLKHGPSPRIDSAATVVDTVGLLIFGGVGVDFEFEAPTTWLLPAVGVTDSSPRAINHRLDTSTAPCARACNSICSDGLRVYMFGGFDGENDLGDLWCLDLAFGCFRNPDLSSDSLLSMLPVRARAHNYAGFEKT